MNLDFFTINCFIAVVETSSFTKAAQRVCRSQSAVSQQMNNLEDKLGKKLLERGKIISTTHDGDIFLSYAKKIHKLNLELFDRFMEPEMAGKISFGLPEDFASVFLSDVLASFALTHPKISLDVECDLTLNLVESFKNKRLDLALVKLNQDSDFSSATEVWSENLEWVGKSDSSIMEDNDTIPLVVSPQPCVYREAAIKALETSNIKWRVVFSSHSFTSLLAAVRAGIGITILPKNMKPKDLKFVQKRHKLPVLEETKISLLREANASATVNAFAQFVIEELTKLR